MSQDDIIQFMPFHSVVNSSFWYKLEELKVDVLKLSDKPQRIYGSYSNIRTPSHIIEIDYSAFNSEFSPARNCYSVQGTLYNKNTIESFKECDKIELINEEGNQLIREIIDGRVLKNPRLLVRLALLSFMDLKRHRYYYWFCFPCPMVSFRQTKDRISLDESKELPVECVLKAFLGITEDANKPFFVLTNKRGNWYVKSLSECDGNPDDYYCYCDPVETACNSPSWVLRLYAFFLSQTL